MISRFLSDTGLISVVIVIRAATSSGLLSILTVDLLKKLATNQISMSNYFAFFVPTERDWQQSSSVLYQAAPGTHPVV